MEARVLRDQLFAAENLCSEQAESYHVEMSICNQRLANFSSLEANTEHQVFLLRSELSLFEAAALGRNDEVAEMKLRLTHSQKQLAKSSLQMAESFQQL